MKFEKFEKEIEKDWYKFFDGLEINIIDKSIEKKLKENPQNTPSADKERNHLIVALAKNRGAWKWIDKAYEVRKHEYYRCYKNSFFFNTPLKEVYSLYTKEYINKLAGIAYWCKENDTEEPLLKIIQKEYNKVYSAFKVNIKELDLDKFIAKRLKKIHKETKDKSEILLERNNQLDELITVALFLANVYNVEITGFLWQKLYTGYLTNTFSSIPSYLIAKTVVNKCEKENLINLIERILETKYNKIKKCKNLNDLYNLLMVEQSNMSRKTASIMNVTAEKLISVENIQKEIVDIIMSDKNKDTSEHLLSSVIERNSSKFFDNVPIREFELIVSYFLTLPKINGLEKEILLDMPINTDIIKTAIVYTLEDDLDDCLDNKKFIDNKLRLQVLTSITILSILEYHKNLKLTTMEHEEEMVVEIENMKNELKDKDCEIAMLKEKIEQLNNIRKTETEDLLHELDLSKKHIKRLKKEVEDSKKDQVEFIALKEYVYRNSLSQEELELTFCDSITIEEKIQYLNDRKIAIFGGHPNWVNKLKKLLPDAKYIDTNAFSSRKFNRLDKYDLLVICNLFISHGLSWKVGEAIKNVKSKKVIILDDVNTNFVINNMFNAIKEYESSL